MGIHNFEDGSLTDDIARARANIREELDRTRPVEDSTELDEEAILRRALLLRVDFALQTYQDSPQDTGSMPFLAC